MACELGKSWGIAVFGGETSLLAFRRAYADYPLVTESFRFDITTFHGSCRIDGRIGNYLLKDSDEGAFFLGCTNADVSGSGKDDVRELQPPFSKDDTNGFMVWLEDRGFAVSSDYRNPICRWDIQVSPDSGYYGWEGN